MSKVRRTKKKAEPEAAFAKALGARVAMLRRQRKWSQETLAAVSGVVAYTVSKVETGHNDARIGTLRRIATALGVTLPEMVEGLEPSLAGRAERRKVNDIAQMLLPLDADTIEVIKTMVSAALRLRGDTAKKRKPNR